MESNKMKNTKYQTVDSVPKIQRKIAKRGKIDPVQEKQYFSKISDEKTMSSEHIKVRNPKSDQPCICVQSAMYMCTISHV
jgi:LysM repeat protein